MGPRGRGAGGAGVFGCPLVLEGFESLSRCGTRLRVDRAGAGTGWQHSQLTPFPFCQSSPHALDPTFSECQEIWVPSGLRLRPAG